MIETTDILSLGETFTIADLKGNIVDSIQIIPASDILDAIGGEYIDGPFNEYITNALSKLTGFDEIDPLKILWYPTTGEEVTLADIAKYAISNGYNKIILEFIEEE